MVVPTSEPSDEMLAVRAAAGDDHAFETIVHRYQARVYRLACRLTSDTDAPDVLQDTFLQVHRHLASFRGDSRFSTWLYRIATNAGLMHRRARARQTRPADRPPDVAGGRAREFPPGRSRGSGIGDSASWPLLSGACEILPVKPTSVGTHRSRLRVG